MQWKPITLYIKMVFKEQYECWDEIQLFFLSLDGQNIMISLPLLKNKCKKVYHCQMNILLIYITQTRV